MWLRTLFNRLNDDRKASNSGSWRSEYEEHSRSHRKRLDAKPVSELLSDVLAGRFNGYYNIWYSIAERANPKDALPILFAALESNDDYLHQYHCAVAILHLSGSEPLENGGYPSNTTAVEYTTSGKNYVEARRCLVKKINEM